jgi:hypothetical protein
MYMCVFEASRSFGSPICRPISGGGQRGENFHHPGREGAAPVVTIQALSKGAESQLRMVEEMDSVLECLEGRLDRILAAIKGAVKEEEVRVPVPIIEVD